MRRLKKPGWQERRIEAWQRAPREQRRKYKKPPTVVVVPKAS